MFKIRKWGVALVAVIAALVLLMVFTGRGNAAPVAGGAVTALSAGSSTSVAVNGLRLRAVPRGWVKGLLYKGDRVFVRETYAADDRNRNWVGVVLTRRSAGGLPKLTRGYVYKSYLR